MNLVVQELSPKRAQAMQRKLTRAMFDENGKISDEAVKLASKGTEHEHGQRLC